MGFALVIFSGLLAAIYFAFLRPAVSGPDIGPLPLGNIPGGNLFSSSNSMAGGGPQVEPGSPFADAIAHAEGFYVNGSIPQRNNNPGDFRSWGHYPQVQGYAAFPTAADGWKALEDELNLIRNGSSHVYKSSMSFRQMGALWADAANDPQGAANWSKNVAGFFEASEDEAIGTYL